MSIEEALARIESTTDMGDFGMGMLNAAAIIRQAIDSDRRIELIALRLLIAHEEKKDPEGCAAHSEGQHCCLDSTHPLGAGLRKALGVSYPQTYTTWGPNGTRTHKTKPFDLETP